MRHPIHYSNETNQKKKKKKKEEEEKVDLNRLKMIFFFFPYSAGALHAETSHYVSEGRRKRAIDMKDSAATMAVYDERQAKKT